MSDEAPPTNGEAHHEPVGIIHVLWWKGTAYLVKKANPLSFAALVRLTRQDDGKVAEERVAQFEDSKDAADFANYLQAVTTRASNVARAQVAPQATEGEPS